MAEQTFIQVRIDSKLKQEATDILNDMGMDLPNAIRMFMKRIVLEQGLPFEAKLPQPAVSPENANDPDVIHIPAKPSLMLSEKEYVEALCLVPAGWITRADDIERYLAKKYGVERVSIDHGPIAFSEDIPFWREVSTRGMLQDVRFRCDKQTQQRKLEQEGLTIVPCGAYNKSLKVENYKDHLFDFNTVDETEG